MGSYGIFMVISGIMGGLFGMAGTILFFKPRKKKEYADAQNSEAQAKMTSANADSVEIRNVSDLTKNLMDLTAEFDKKLDEYRQKLDEQSDELFHLKSINRQIIDLIEQITPENIECIVTKIKKIVEKP